MCIHKLGHAFAALLIATASTTVLSSKTPSLGSHCVAGVPSVVSCDVGAQVVAQTVDAKKVEADRLLQQGIKQYETNQFNAALQSWQQALQIYREIKDRLGEGQSLGSLGIAYYSLGDYPKAIDYLQQSLKIKREIKDKDRKGEGAALNLCRLQRLQRMQIKPLTLLSFSTTYRVVT